MSRCNNAQEIDGYAGSGIYLCTKLAGHTGWHVHTETGESWTSSRTFLDAEAAYGREIILSAPTRPSIDESMLATAAVWSRRSTCSRLSVGAVLARAGRVLSCGYNGAPAKLDHCQHESDESCTVSVHAEANALISAGRFGASTDGATLYLTHAPCVACSGLIINAGVRAVVFREKYRNDDGIERLWEGGLSVNWSPEPGIRRVTHDLQL